MRSPQWSDAELPVLETYDRSAFVLEVSAAYERIGALRDRVIEARARLDDLRAIEVEVAARRADVGRAVFDAARVARREETETERACARIIAVAEAEADRVRTTTSAELDALRLVAARLERGPDAEILDIRARVDASARQDLDAVEPDRIVAV